MCPRKVVQYLHTYVRLRVKTNTNNFCPTDTSPSNRNIFRAASHCSLQIFKICIPLFHTHISGKPTERGEGLFEEPVAVGPVQQCVKLRSAFFYPCGCWLLAGPLCPLNVLTGKSSTRATGASNEDLAKHVAIVLQWR